MGDKQQSFRSTLNRISNKTISNVDYELSSSRFYINDVGNKSYNNLVCIMSKNVDVHIFNDSKLKNLNQPIALTTAKHNYHEALTASFNEAEGLSADPRLYTGARMLLRKDLWV